MFRTKIRLLMVAAPIALVACQSDLPTATDPVTFTKTASGLYFKDVPVGWGRTASLRDTVTVDYAGYLTSGALFDSSRRTTNSTFTFVLGDSTVIKGWEEGVQGMKVGGKRRLVIPPNLAYGAIGSGAIPPFAILVFDITLHGVR
jgi:FKBP-type peptidyl-prolyl cis-trans isomerase FkpA